MKTPGAALAMLVMFGVLGGVVVFGLAGLFIAPPILAVAQAVRRECITIADLENSLKVYWRALAYPEDVSIFMNVFS